MVLLVHGNPECSYTWRHVAAALARRSLPRGTRVLAVDHLGAGRSDQARAELVDAHHADHLRQLVTALDLRDVTLVVHDWGGPIGLGAFLDEPERVTGLVVLNTTVFPMPADRPTFNDWPLPLLPWSRTPSLVPDALWGDLAGVVVGLTPSGAAGLAAAGGRALLGRLRPPPPRVETTAARVFRDQFRSRGNVRSSKRLVRSTARWGHGYAYRDPVRGPQDTTAFYRRLQEVVPAAWGPGGRGIGVAALFGAWDPLAKPSVLAQWRSALPQLTLTVFDDVSHFVEEHRPEEIADAVAALLRR